MKLKKFTPQSANNEHNEDAYNMAKTETREETHCDLQLLRLTWIYLAARTSRLIRFLV